MRRLSLTLSATVLALSLAACGGTDTNNTKPSAKADVAKALQRLYSADKTAANATPTQAFSADEEKTVAGQKGTAKVTTHTEADVTGGGASLKVTYTIVYTGYSSDGVNVYDGTETMATTQSAGGDSAEQVSTLKGKVTMTGEFETVLEHDVSVIQAVHGASVTLKVTGTAAADATSFSFQDESFDVNVSVE